MENTGKDKVSNVWNSCVSLERDQQQYGLISCWPPRQYVCDYCKREFMSAQGLGGHMNIHRRERAGLIQSSSSVSESSIRNADPNSNPTAFLVSPSLDIGLSSPSSMYHVNAKMPTTTTTDQPLHATSSSNTRTMSSKNSGEGGHYGKGPLAQEDIHDEFEASGLDLEMSLTIGGSKNEDLDLELRLGKP